MRASAFVRQAALLVLAVIVAAVMAMLVHGVSLDQLLALSGGGDLDDQEYDFVRQDFRDLTEGGGGDREEDDVLRLMRRALSGNWGPGDGGG